MTPIISGAVSVGNGGPTGASGAPVSLIRRIKSKNDSSD